MKPMLAFKYADKKKAVRYPCFVQPKLNGIRMLAQGPVLQSRSHGLVEAKRWTETRLVKIREALSNIPDHIVLDGEVYLHGWSLQKINGAAAVNRLEDTNDTNQLQYHVFDCLDLNHPQLNFDERLSTLLHYCAGRLPFIHIVPTFRAISEGQAEEYYATFKQERYEGMMYRLCNHPYGLEASCTNQQNRWVSLLKRKDWLDEEFLISGMEIGEGKHESKMGALVLDLPNGLTFKCGTGFSDDERERFWTTESPLGRLASIKYEMLSDVGIPLKPSFIELT